MTKELFLETLGVKIKKVRALRRLTTKQLSANLGITQRHIQLIEKGERNAPVYLIHKIASALNISLSILFIEDEVFNDMIENWKKNETTDSI